MVRMNAGSVPTEGLAAAGNTSGFRPEGVGITGAGGDICNWSGLDPTISTGLEAASCAATGVWGRKLDRAKAGS